MRRYWVDAEFIGEENVFLTGDNHHHICAVCRVKEGQRFEIFNDQGIAYLVELNSKEKRQSVAKIIEKRQMSSLGEVEINLVTGFPRFEKFEFILEKITELGAHRVMPFFGENTFIKSAAKISPKKYERWQRIVRSACEQSGRYQPLEIAEPRPLAGWLEEINLSATEAGLFLYEGQCEQSLRSYLGPLQQSGVKKLWVFIGSEGGFSASEVELMKEHGLPPLSLGDQVLRFETACLALVSIIKYVLAGETSTTRTSL